MATFYKDGRLLKKRQTTDFGGGDDNTDIQVSLNVETSRLSSDLAIIAQEYADTTALETAAKLSLTSQISVAAATQSEATSVSSATLANSLANVQTSTTDIATAADAITSFGQMLAYWPLYTTNDYGYDDRYRDMSGNGIDLVVSGTESVNGYGLHNYTDYYFNAISPVCSGFGSLGNNYKHALINDTESSGSLVLSSYEPVSFSFITGYDPTIATYAVHLIDFNDQYTVYRDEFGQLSLKVGEVTTSAHMNLGDFTLDHCVITYDPVARLATFYKNGEYIDSDANVGSPGDAPEDGKIKLAYHATYPSVESLVLYDVAIYKACLSNSSVKALYDTYKNRYGDYTTGGVYASSNANGNNNLMVDPSTGTLDGLNFSRKIGGTQIDHSLLDGTLSLTDGERASTLLGHSNFMSYYSRTNSSATEPWTVLGLDTYVKYPGDAKLLLNFSAHAYVAPGTYKTYFVDFYAVGTAEEGASTFSVKDSNIISGVTPNYTGTQYLYDMDVTDFTDYAMYFIISRIRAQHPSDGTIYGSYALHANGAYGGSDQNAGNTPPTGY